MGIRPAERMDFWHQAHLGRMVLSKAGHEVRPFEGRVRRVLGAQAHLVEHASDALVAVRDQQQCRRDGVDYVSINVLLTGSTGVCEHGGVQRLRAGSIYFVDSALPVQFRLPRHHSISIFLPRGQVQGALAAGGTSPADSGRTLLPPGLQASTGKGIGAVLQSHMRMVAAQAAFMSPEQRVTTIAACVDMALAVVQAAKHGTADAEQFAGGFYLAARRFIEHHCSDPELNPQAVATAIGCSRASLYRLFAHHGESVAALIWARRLAHAHHMITSGRHMAMPLAKIGFCSGFTDQSAFTRTFRRRYGMTPGEARALALTSVP
jgi:AraC-like DNA-binding protein